MTKFVYIDVAESQVPVLIRVKSKHRKSLYCALLKNEDGGLYIRKVDKNFGREREKLFAECGDNFCD